MFDAKTFKNLKQIPAAEDADAIIYDVPSDRVFTFNGDAHSSTVIDSNGNLVTNIPLGGKPEYGASAGDGKVYANLTDTSEIVEIDSKAAKVTRRWSTAACKQPVSMALDSTHHRLFSGCRSGVMAISDYQAGRIVATLPIGKGVDHTGIVVTEVPRRTGQPLRRSQAQHDPTHRPQRRPDRRDTAGIAQYGHRSHESSRVCGFC